MFALCNRSAVLLVAAFTLSQITFNASAAKGSNKVNAPGSFRVASKTAYTVTVAWSAPSGFSGDFNYHLSGAYGVTPATLPKTSTGHTFTRLFPGNEYWFFIYAKDASGKVSVQANLGPIRLPNDTTPPTSAPIVSFDQVGANYANMSWIPAQDDGPHLTTEFYLNGAFYGSVGRGVTNATLRFLEPDTTYSFTARAVDFGNNAGPFSGPVALITPPPNPNDTTAPTTPANLWADIAADGSTETWLRWSQTDDGFDAQSSIRYDVYVNGIWADVLFGSGGPSIVYADFGESLIEVTATDSAGNISAPATVTVFF